MSTLRRTLGTTDLTLLVVGNVIGSGIFIVPSVVLRQTNGSVAAASLVWLIGGILSLLGALSYAELSSMDRKAGGLYAFIRDGFGPFPAFLYGWTLFFVIGAGTIATLAVAASNYLGQFRELSMVEAKVVSVSLIVIMAVINVLGTRGSASVQNTATAIKVLAILAMSVLLFTLGDPPAAAPAAATAQPESTVTLAAIGIAMISVLWAYEGWQYVTFSDAEAKDPQRSLPRALAIGMTVLIVIYLIANLAYLAALGPSGMMATDRVAASAMAEVMGPAAGKVIAAIIIISMYSAAHATVITTPRVYYAMANEGLFFSALARVHPRYGTPAVAIITSCTLAAVLALTGTFEQLLTYVVFVGWVFYALGAAALISLRIKRPDAARPFTVPGYPVTPLLFILAAAAIVGNTIYNQPSRALIGLGMVLLGAPAYLIWRKSRPAGE